VHRVFPGYTRWSRGQGEEVTGDGFWLIPLRPMGSIRHDRDVGLGEEFGQVAGEVSAQLGVIGAEEDDREFGGLELSGCDACVLLVDVEAIGRWRHGHSLVFTASAA
jgi:hypothetical protein